MEKGQANKRNENVYVKTPTPVKIKTSTTATDIRSYIENFTLFRKLSAPEWNLLRGKFPNKKIKEMTKKDILQKLS